MHNHHRLLLLTLTGLTAAHMELTSPPPLRSKSNPHTTPGNADYSMTSPLHNDGSDYPCKGYLSLLSSPDGAAVATWTAGTTQTFTVSGGAPHGGGSCQAALSVDGGRTFRVLHSYEGGCPGTAAGGEGSEFGFTLPGDVPATQGAVFAWTWFNNLGNREMYMNCAVVDVVAGGGGGGGKQVAFGERPAVFRANVGNGCRTVDSANVKFPDPGPDVDSNGAATPPTGSCGATAPGGGNQGGSGFGSGAGSGSGSGSGSGVGSSQGSSDATVPMPSPTRASPPPHRTSKPSPTPVADGAGGVWTPGNDWPEGFQSPAARSVGHIYLVAFFCLLLFV